MSENVISVPEGAKGLARLAIGLLQGLALYLLLRSTDGPVWPATEPMIFAPLFAIALFVPVFLLLDLGVLKLPRLVFWALAASVFVGGLAFFDIYRGAEPAWGREAKVLGYPSPMVLTVISLSLFIAQCLVIPSEAERRVPASYPRYFDEAWKCAVQLIFSVVFVGLFWGVLALGAELFELLKVHFFSDLLKHRWFAVPVTTLALAAAIHLTDIKVAIVRGIRTLKLTLLSWLLPLMTLIAAGFVVALPFTGLDPLWRTRFAVWLLMAASVALIVLINAAYQDGQEERAPHRLLRYAGSLAILTLPVLVGLASYALWLRVEQRGWTASRIEVAAAIGILGFYALGYIVALHSRRGWVRRLETVNVVAAALVLGVIVAFFTPLADPARLAVADQVRRLESGRVSPAQFDFVSLRYDGARYGKEALERLKTDNIAAVREKAESTLKLASRYGGKSAPNREDIASHVTVHPAGKALSEAFLAQDWKSFYAGPSCLRDSTSRCDAFFVDLDGDGTDEVVLVGSSESANYTLGSPGMVALRLGSDGKWALFGTFAASAPYCRTTRAEEAGELKLIPPLFPDIQLGGRRLRLNPQSLPCP